MGELVPFRRKRDPEPIVRVSCGACGIELQPGVEHACTVGGFTFTLDGTDGP